MASSKEKKEKPGQKRIHKPVSAEAERVGKEIDKARGDKPLTEIAKLVPTSHQNLSKIIGGRSSLDDERTRGKIKRLGQIFNNDWGLSWVREYLDEVRSANGPIGPLPNEEKPDDSPLPVKEITTLYRKLKSEDKATLSRFILELSEGREPELFDVVILPPEDLLDEPEEDEERQPAKRRLGKR